MTGEPAGQEQTQAAVCDHPVHSTYIKGGEPLVVRVCVLCGQPDWEDLRRQVDVLRAAWDAAAFHPGATVGRTWVPPAIVRLPYEAWVSARTGAASLDARVLTAGYIQNVIAHAVVALWHDGWIRDTQGKPRPYLRARHDPAPTDGPADPPSGGTSMDTATPTTRETFGFKVRSDEPLTLETAVFQALGEVSVCWETMDGAGTFDSTRAAAVGQRLVAAIRSGTLVDPDAADRDTLRGLVQRWWDRNIIDGAQIHLTAEQEEQLLRRYQQLIAAGRAAQTGHGEG